MSYKTDVQRDGQSSRGHAITVGLCTIPSYEENTQVVTVQACLSFLIIKKGPSYDTSSNGKYTL